MRTYLLEAQQVVVQAALLQEAPELGGDVEPGVGVAGHVAHKRKGLVCLRPTHTGSHTHTNTLSQKMVISRCVW